jgi:hypothetical protein
MAAQETAPTTAAKLTPFRLAAEDLVALAAPAVLEPVGVLEAEFVGVGVSKLADPPTSFPLALSYG